MIRIAERLGGASFGTSTEIYLFEKIKRAKAAARREHPDVELLDFDVGEPGWPADGAVVRTLAEEAGKPENRRYADNGIPEFQDAAAGYLASVYGVTGLDARTQIIHGLGSKPILAMLPLCFLNPGDVLLTTTPGYPVAATHARYLGAEVHSLPLYRSNGFLPDLESVPMEVVRRARLLYLNYPNNPTGAVATREFFQEVVEFARKNDLLVVHDAAYGALTFDSAPLSFLSVPGACEVGVEVHSLSKAFSMTGWRMGFLAGNVRAVQAFATVKDNTDSGQFRAIQKAAVTALTHPELTERAVTVYSRRLRLLAEALRRAGFPARKSPGTFYLYVEAPTGTRDGLRFANAATAAEFLLTQALVSTVPWDQAGPHLRFAVTFEAATEAEERRVIAELQDRLERLNLIFNEPRSLP